MLKRTLSIGPIGIDIRMRGTPYYENIYRKNLDFALGDCLSKNGDALATLEVSLTDPKENSNEFKKTVHRFSKTPAHKRVILFHRRSTLFYFCREGKGYLFIEKGDFGWDSLLNALWFIVATNSWRIGAIFLHSAAIKKDDRGYLFLGPSGAGKSTVLRLASPSCRFSDEGNIVRKKKDSYWLYATPHNQRLGEAEIIEKKKLTASRAKLHAVYHLIKDSRTYCEPVEDRGESLKMILKSVFFLPYFDKESARKTFILCYQLSKTYPFYQLHFAQSKEFLRCLK